MPFPTTAAIEMTLLKEISPRQVQASSGDHLACSGFSHWRSWHRDADNNTLILSLL